MTSESHTCGRRAGMGPEQPGELRLGTDRVDPRSEGDSVGIQVKGMHRGPGLIGNARALHCRVGGFESWEGGRLRTIGFDRSTSVSTDPSANVIVSRWV